MVTISTTIPPTSMDTIVTIINSVQNTKIQTVTSQKRRFEVHIEVCYHQTIQCLQIC